MKVKQLLTRTTGALGVTAGLLFVGSPLMAQVKIGDNPNTINPSSILELESATKGLLLPRVALTSTSVAAPVTNAVAGMHVYNTNENDEVQPGEYFYDGSTWVRLNSNDTYNYIEGNGAPTGSCPAKTIYTDSDEDSGTFGQQWTCINGAWVVYKSPTKTAFFAGFTQNDAGGAKRGVISRYGHIVSMRETPAGQGKSTIAPGGIIQLLRGPGIDAGYGAAIDLSDAPGNPLKYRIAIRPTVQGGNGGLVFHTAASAAAGPVARMMLTPSGKLGIGVNFVAADNIVHVNGSLQGSEADVDAAGLAQGTSALSGYRFYQEGVRVVNGVNTQINRAQIIVQSGDTPNLVLTKRVMPAASEPFVVFRVNGTEEGRIFRDANGDVRFPAATSDRRLKENIKSTHYSIDDLMKIGVVEYNYITNPKKETTIGFIAQDLYKVFPEAVTVGGDDAKANPWRVDATKITPLLVKAVQDQQKEIAALKAQLSEMNALKAEVASIKAMLGNAAQEKSEATISK
ncbi:tail fiber domain-containing protein [Dyadobacter jiangsuensis]|uniref:Endosialidase-like protein n=1 Tax=Dyadobacter jiangsuensis TaxID=1591085 RepID=A0A2P8FLA8_9BACT|nr:tail fiber domain-containing protein [Dyadobacter jiangsuensis]PSL22501.1 endosialidase-like protein [Dyadobacter jiangsuensis]